MLLTPKYFHLIFCWFVLHLWDLRFQKVFQFLLYRFWAKLSAISFLLFILYERINGVQLGQSNCRKLIYSEQFFYNTHFTPTPPFLVGKFKVFRHLKKQLTFFVVCLKLQSCLLYRMLLFPQCLMMMVPKLCRRLARDISGLVGNKQSTFVNFGKSSYVRKNPKTGA